MDWHGWSVGGVRYHVGPLPGRKQIALYEMREGEGGTRFLPVAYFASDLDARHFLRFLDRLAGEVRHVVA